MKCEGCGSDMDAQPPSADEPSGEDDAVKWKCPRCGSWCLAIEDEVVMGAWLLQGPGWPR